MNQNNNNNNNQVSVIQIIKHILSKWKIIISLTVLMTSIGYITSSILSKEIWESKLIFVIKNNTPIETLFGVYKSPLLLSQEAIEDICNSADFPIESSNSDLDIGNIVSEVIIKQNEEHKTDEFITLTVQVTIAHEDSLQIADITNSYYSTILNKFDNIITNQIHTYFNIKLNEDIRKYRSETLLIDHKLELYDSISKNSKPASFMSLDTKSEQFILTNPKYIDLDNEILILLKAKADYESKIKQWNDYLNDYLNDYFNSTKSIKFPNIYTNQFVSLMSDVEKVTKTSTINVKKSASLIAFTTLVLSCLFFFIQLLIKEESNK